MFGDQAMFVSSAICYGANGSDQPLARRLMDWEDFDMRLLLVSSLLIGLASAAFAELPLIRTPMIQVEGAANLRFRKGGCRPPEQYSLRRLFGRQTFTLQNGDIGNCGGDDQPKKTYKPTAPYVERVEASSFNNSQGQRYLFSAFVHFDPNFTSVDQTAFFTVHQWDSKTCRCSPYIRLILDQAGNLYAMVLKRPTKPVAYRLANWNRADFANKWVEVAVDIDTSSNQALTVYIGGQPELTTSVLVRDGGSVYVKVGLLRPGNTNVRLPTDRVHFRSARYSNLKR